MLYSEATLLYARESLQVLLEQRGTCLLITQITAETIDAPDGTYICVQGLAFPEANHWELGRDLPAPTEAIYRPKGDFAGHLQLERHLGYQIEAPDSPIERRWLEAEFAGRGEDRRPVMVAA